MAISQVPYCARVQGHCHHLPPQSSRGRGGNLETIFFLQTQPFIHFFDNHSFLTASCFTLSTFILSYSLFYSLSRQIFYYPLLFLSFQQLFLLSISFSRPNHSTLLTALFGLPVGIFSLPAPTPPPPRLFFPTCCFEVGPFLHFFIQVYLSERW